MSRELNKWTRILNTCQTLLPSKVISNYYISPQSTEVIANMGTAVLEFLNNQLFGDQHLQEQKATLNRQTEQLLDILSRYSFI